MLSKVLSAPAILLAFLVLLAQPLAAAEKNVSLADFNGTWQMDAQKSQPNTREVAGKLKALTGFKFTVNAKDKTIRMEWADHEPKTSKVVSSTGEGKELSCKLEGYNATMLMEKISDTEVGVKDREETLVFIKVK